MKKGLYVRVDTKFASHPKVLEIGPLGEALWLRGLCYSGEQMTDGFVPAAFVRRMGDIPDALGVAATLVAVGLWDEAEGGFQVHDYLDWQRGKEEIEQISAARAESGRRGGLQTKSQTKPTNDQPASKPEANAKQNESKTKADTDTDTDTDTEPEKELPPNPPRGEMSKQQETQFETFWSAYPRKEGKGAARSWWAKKKPASDLVDQMLVSVEGWKRSLQWQRDNGQYIPHPNTWLNQSRWEDEIPPAASAAEVSAHDRTSPGLAGSPPITVEAIEANLERRRIEREQREAARLTGLPPMPVTAGGSRP